MDLKLKKYIDRLIEENNISKLKEVLQTKLLHKKNDYLLELLSLVEILLGNFQNSLNYLNQIENKSEGVIEYIKFLKGSIKEKYMPLYNDLLKGIGEKEEIQEILQKLEEILPNVELYQLASLYYLDKNEKEQSLKYIEKALELDSCNKESLRISDFILQKQIPEIKNSKNKYGVYFLILGLLGILFGFYEKYSLENKINLKNIEFKKLEKVNQQSTVNLNQLKEELKLEKNKNLKLQKEKNINIVKNEVVEPEKIDETLILKNDFTAKELFNKGLKLRKEQKYSQALKYFEILSESNEDSIYSRESMFWLGKTYENLGRMNEAIKVFNSYLIKYSNTQIYTHEVKTLLKKYEAGGVK